jgi:hypothetical protein
MDKTAIGAGNKALRLTDTEPKKTVAVVDDEMKAEVPQEANEA